MARIRKKSVVDGHVRTLFVSAYTQEEYEHRIFYFNEGRIPSIEEALPLLSTRAHIFVKYGITEEEWDEHFGNKI